MDKFMGPADLADAVAPPKRQTAAEIEAAGRRWHFALNANAMAAKARADAKAVAKAKAKPKPKRKRPPRRE